MIQAYSKRDIKNVLYTLKKEWGCTVQYYHLISNERDLRSGLRDQQFQIITIRRAILLPSELIRSLSALCSKPFQYGGDYNNATRIMLVDRKDLIIDLDPIDYVIVDADRYSIKKLEDFDFYTGNVFQLNHIPPKDLE